MSSEIRIWVEMDKDGQVPPQSKSTIYSRTSVARTPLGPWKLVRERGSSSEWGLIKAPGQEE